MSSSFLGFGALLFTLPILVGQWIGILGLGKSDRGPAWRLMLAGACLSTLGTIGSVLFVAVMMFGLSSTPGTLSSGVFSILISGGFSGLGSLLFAIGFAIHGQQASKTRQRVTELEAIAAAQGEELNRHRASYTSAS